MKKKGPKKRVKLKLAGVILVLVVLVILGLFIYNILTRRISNIYISGNYYLSDWDVITEAKIDNYPNSFSNSSMLIEN